MLRLLWLHDVHFEQPALEATLVDYVHEVHHARERIARLEQAIDEAVANAPEEIRSVQHSDGEAEKFYRDLKLSRASVRVGLEVTAILDGSNDC